MFFHEILADKIRAQELLYRRTQKRQKGPMGWSEKLSGSKFHGSSDGGGRSHPLLSLQL